MLHSTKLARHSFKLIVPLKASKRFFRLSLIFAVCCASGCREPNVYQAPPPPEVTVAKPVMQTVKIYLEENGETEAVGRSEVRARVKGVLEKVEFDPGDDVQAGDLLYVIEKDEYIAIRDGANAELAAAKASLNAAIASISVAKADLVAAKVKVDASESEFRRQDQLYKDKVSTKSVWEEAKAIRDGALASRLQAEAAVEAAIAKKETSEAQVTRAEASRQRAELELSYTDVKAQISGRITNSIIKPGNLVESGSHLTTIVQRDPIWANFNINERYLLALMNSEKNENNANKGNDNYKNIKAALKRAGDDGYPFKGHLDYIDQEGVDQGTGTLKLRAIFDNPESKLLPGLFVRVQIPIGVMENALLIPEKAIGRDQSGTFLLVLDEQGTVDRKNVTIGTKYGELIVIEKGIEADDTVIIDGIQRARPGSKVAPKSVQLEFDPGTAEQETVEEKLPETTSQAPQE